MPSTHPFEQLGLVWEVVGVPDGAVVVFMVLTGSGVNTDNYSSS